jgi:N-acetylneuraminic acid mutarotase
LSGVFRMSSDSGWQITLAAREAWTRKADMPAVPCAGIRCATVDGKIYCIAGYAGYRKGFHSGNYMYDPETDTWTQKAGMPKALYQLDCAVVDGKIYCVGGNGTSGLQKTCYMYDPAMNKWAGKARIATLTYRLSCTATGGKMYYMGGSNGLPMSNVYMYDPATDAWTRKADMPAAKENAGSVTADGKIYCIGGNSAATYMYDPANDAWTEKAGIPAGKSEFGCVDVDGKIYCMGGVIQPVTCMIRGGQLKRTCRYWRRLTEQENGTAGNNKQIISLTAL